MGTFITSQENLTLSILWGHDKPFVTTPAIGHFEQCSFSNNFSHWLFLGSSFYRNAADWFTDATAFKYDCLCFSHLRLKNKFNLLTKKWDQTTPQNISTMYSNFGVFWFKFGRVSRHLFVKYSPEIILKFIICTHGVVAATYSIHRMNITQKNISGRYTLWKEKRTCKNPQRKVLLFLSEEYYVNFLLQHIRFAKSFWKK